MVSIRGRLPTVKNYSPSKRNYARSATWRIDMNNCIACPLRVCEQFLQRRQSFFSLKTLLWYNTGQNAANLTVKVWKMWIFHLLNFEF